MAFGIKTIGGGNVGFDVVPTSANTTVTIDNVTGIPVYGDAVTGAMVLPSGTTAQRTSSPTVGAIRQNLTLGIVEIWNGYNWGNINGKLPSTYRTQRSLRFRASVLAYLNRTFSTPTDGKKFTWSGWVKKCDVRTGVTGSSFALSIPYSTGAVGLVLSINGSNQIGYINWDGATVIQYVYTNAEFRDPSAWYHIVYSFDSTQANTSDRLKIYVNSIYQTLTVSNAIPLNDASLNNSGNRNICVGQGNSSKYFDGYLADVYFVDGQALDPSYFGEVDVIAGTWIPKAYTGTYGTNGFYLEFKDNSAATAAAIGKDTSGNGNNWTPNNISVTAGVTYDSMLDVPTLTSSTAANFATLNPLKNSTDLSNANLNFAAPTLSVKSSTGTIAVKSRKYYFEYVATAIAPQASIAYSVGVGKTSISISSPSSSDYYLYNNNGSKSGGGAGAVAYGASFVVGDVVGVALDMDGGTLTFYKNNVSQGVAFSGLTGLELSAFVSIYSDSPNTTSGYVNFGQRPFSYTPPSGYLPLNTYNLP